MSSILNVSHSIKDGIGFIVIQGEVDAHTVTQLQSALDAVSDAPKGIVYDCSGLRYFASAGIGATAAVHRKLVKNGADLVFAAVPEAIVPMIKTLTARSINMVPGVADAVKLLGAK